MYFAVHGTLYTVYLKSNFSCKKKKILETNRRLAYAKTRWPPPDVSFSQFSLPQSFASAQLPHLDTFQAGSVEVYST